MTELDEKLADWHIWSSKTEHVSQAGKCAMFSQASSPRHWDSTGEIDDAHIHRVAMEALDFAILGDKRGQGGLIEPHRTAVTFYARNLTAKTAQWHSPRLPVTQKDRIELVNRSLSILTTKLKSAGVL